VLSEKNRYPFGSIRKEDWNEIVALTSIFHLYIKYLVIKILK